MSEEAEWGVAAWKDALHCFLKVKILSLAPRCFSTEPALPGRGITKGKGTGHAPQDICCHWMWVGERGVIQLHLTEEKAAHQQAGLGSKSDAGTLQMPAPSYLLSTGL